MRWILTCFLLFKLSAQETITLTDNTSLLIVQERKDNILRKEVKDGANNTYSKQCFEYNDEGKLTSVRSSLIRNDIPIQDITKDFTYTEGQRTLIRAKGSSEEEETHYFYNSTNQIYKKTLPNGIELYYEYDGDYLVKVYSSDGSVEQYFNYDQSGNLIYCNDIYNHVEIKRTYEQNNLIEEKINNFPPIRFSYQNDLLTAITFPSIGSIHYTYEDGNLKEVKRVDREGNIRYSHRYEAYVDATPTVDHLPFALGTAQKHIFKKRKTIISSNPWYPEKIAHISKHHAYSYQVGKQKIRFPTDKLGQLIDGYCLDSLHNPIHAKVNSLNQVLECGSSKYRYSKNGNVISKEKNGHLTTFIYDALDRLITVDTGSVKYNYFYDALGRRIFKTSSTGEKYISFYYDNDELALFSRQGPKYVFIPGLQRGIQTKAIAFEIQNKPYIPIYDLFGNVKKLIEPTTKQVETISVTPFGEHAHSSIPWAYASRHLDTETGLIYFGARYYDPEMRQFFTRDPLELFSDDNPYAYVQGNPVALFDKNGRAAFAAPLLTFAYGAGTATLSTAILPAAALMGTCYCGYLIYENQQIIGNTLQDTTQAISHFCRGKPKSYTVYPDNTTSILYPDGYWEYAYINQQSDPKKPSYLQRKKEGSVDDSLSTDPLNDSNYEDISHPRGKEKGHYKFKDKRTGEIIEFDKGKPEWPGHKAHDHYHRPNPNKTGKFDEYLDSQGKPVPDKSDPSHLYPSEWVWWE